MNSAQCPCGIMMSSHFHYYFYFGMKSLDTSPKQEFFWYSCFITFYSHVNLTCSSRSSPMLVVGAKIIIATSNLSLKRQSP